MVARAERERRKELLDAEKTRPKPKSVSKMDVRKAARQVLVEEQQVSATKAHDLTLQD